LCGRREPEKICLFAVMWDFSFIWSFSQIKFRPLIRVGGRGGGRTV
jgi:hypothetical protein